MKRNAWKEKFQEAVRRIRGFARRPGPVAATPQPRVGLALGGGFARGLAHIGVLKVLEENHIPLHCLAGTSVGSIIAGAYASGASVEEMAAVAGKVRWKDFGRWTLSRLGLASNQRLEAFVKRTFRALRFEDMRIPLAVVATNLTDGQAVVFSSGELGLAVRASCAYPGLFLPVAYNGSWLADGALVAVVPAEAAKALGADIVIGVSLDTRRPGLEPKSVVDVLSRAFSIAQLTAEPLWREHADIIVNPQVGDFRWDDFARAHELIAAGEEAMREALPELRRQLEPAALAPARPSATRAASP